MTPPKRLNSRGCSSVVERVLRMYEAPGSTPGSSICVILSRSFASFFFFSFFNVVQWIPFNITPFLLQGPWCHPTRAFTEGKKRRKRRKKEGREEKKEPPSSASPLSEAPSLQSYQLTHSFWAPFERIPKWQDGERKEIRTIKQFLEVFLVFEHWLV